MIIKCFTLKVKRWLKLNQTCKHIDIFIWSCISSLRLEESIKLGACVCFVFFFLVYLFTGAMHINKHNCKRARISPKGYFSSVDP